MTIVQELYKKNVDITDKELAEEIIKHTELTALDLWLLPQHPFDVWRRKYDYPRLLENIKARQADFTTWMNEQGITDEYLLSGYISDFFKNKPLSVDKKQYLIKSTYKEITYLQVWENFDIKNPPNTEGVTLEFVKEFISYYDWLLLKGTTFNFIDTYHSDETNTVSEEIYFNHNIRLLKMGGIEPPTNSIGSLLRGKKLEFINATGLDFRNTIYLSHGHLSFNHCALDNMKCNDLNLHTLDFENCSIRNLQVKNSNISGWNFITSYTTGNIIDSKIPYLEIYGGLFNPTFTNSEIGDVTVEHKNIIHDPNFEKTYRTLSKSVYESGNLDLSKNLKIREYDFIRDKTKGFRWFVKTIDKGYWEYGQRPKRLIYISIGIIIFFGLIYSAFPENFKGMTLHDDPYWKILYNTQYYSAITFTTLGYGDISPIGFLKLLAAFEAFLGAVTMGFLVAGLAKTE